jgi:DNA polymerase III alpha subunit
MSLTSKHDFDLVEIVKSLSQTNNEKGKPYIRGSRMETIKRKSEPYKQIYFKNKVSEVFANWFYEKNLLGYTYNKNLKDIFSDKREDLISVREAEDLPVDSRVVFIGTINEKPFFGASKNGNNYMKIFVEDETATMKTMIFNKKLDQCEQINNGFPKEKNIVIVKGVTKDEVLFADSISVQSNKIYTKLSDLKDS